MSSNPIVPKIKVHCTDIIVHSNSVKEWQLSNIFSKSLALQKKELELFPLIGRVTALIGSSSVGKSSIIANMRAQQSDLLESGVDIENANMIYDHFKATCPIELDFLESVLITKPQRCHIHDAVAGKKFAFKDSVSEEDQLKAKKAAQVLMDCVSSIPPCLSAERFEFLILDRVMPLALSGKPCVFDILNAESVAKHAIGRMPKKIALIYCPLDVYVSRILHRNHKATLDDEPSELRVGIYPLEQMAQVFRPTANRDEVIFSLSRKQLIANFNRLIEDWTARTPPGEDKPNYEENLAKILEAFGFKDPSIVKLSYTPCFKGYDAIIDTSVINSHTAAKILLRN
jgi:hypothetical protein